MPVDREWQFEFDGFLFGDGTSYPVSKVEGFNLPELRTRDFDKPSEDGQFPGSDFLSGRRTTWHIGIDGEPGPDLFEKTRALRAAFRKRPVEETLEYRFRGQTAARILLARPRRLALDWDDDAALGASKAVVELYATDPREYAGTLSSGSTGLPTTSGGRTYPRTYPLTYGTAGETNHIGADNSGDYETWPTARVDGPIDNFTIRHDEKDQELTFLISLAAGEWLDIDFKEKTVLLNGTASRYSTLKTSDWFTLDPGHNSIRFTADTAQTGGLLTLSWRSAWT